MQKTTSMFSSMTGGEALKGMWSAVQRRPWIPWAIPQFLIFALGGLRICLDILTYKPLIDPTVGNLFLMCCGAAFIVKALFGSYTMNPSFLGLFVAYAMAVIQHMSVYAVIVLGPLMGRWVGMINVLLIAYIVGDILTNWPQLRRAVYRTYTVALPMILIPQAMATGDHLWSYPPIGPRD
jgi:hypothetical protein